MTTLVHLQAGRPYPIRMEYFHAWREATARLLWLPPNLSQDAVNAARKADVVIAVVGITPQFEGEESDSSDPGFFGGDRLDLNLPRPQQELLESVAATGKPLIVVLTNGSALAVNTPPPSSKPGIRVRKGAPPSPTFFPANTILLAGCR